MNDANQSLVLSPNEELLIRKHIKFYDALARGTRAPKTNAQKHFIDVTMGLAAAKTEHEIAYIKFRIMRKKKQDEINQNNPSNLRDPNDGPTSDWYTNEDYYKFHRRN